MYTVRKPVDYCTKCKSLSRRNKKSGPDPRRGGWPRSQRLGYNKGLPMPAPAMSPINAAAVAQFAETFADAVIAFISRYEIQAVYINYSLDDQRFYWEVTEEGIAGDDVDLLIPVDWQRHTGPIHVPLQPDDPGYSREKLHKAIATAIRRNGFAAQAAAAAYASACADFAPLDDSRPTLH